MAEGKPKTNDFCPENMSGKCKKIKRFCSNKSNFYLECNVYRGNKSLSSFLG